MKPALAAVLLLAILAAPVLAHKGAHGPGHEEPAPTSGGVFQGGELQLAKETLVDQNGRQRPYPWGVAENGLMVMTFGYTTCESICPLGNAVMAQLEAALGPDTPQRVRLISVTIDPTTDTPEIMRKAAAEFGASEHWLWLTGDAGVVDRLLRSAGAKTAYPELHDPVFLVGDPRTGRFYRSQSLPRAEELLAVVRSFQR